MANKITVNVNLAIAHYNAMRTPKQKQMTTESLALKVFADELRMTDRSKAQTVSSWNSGDKISRFQLKHAVVILKETGIEVEKLLPCLYK